MHVASGRGTTLALHDLGGEGPGLLIAHATGFCGRAYQPLARSLAARHHLWAVDFPGHGDSPAPPGDDFGWQGMVVDLLAVSDAIGLAPLHVFGHSMGGAVALQAEATRPGTFATAFLYEPIITAPGALMTDNPLADGARRRNATFPSREAALWRYASRPPLDELSAGSLAAYVEHGFEVLPDGRATLKCRPEHEARTFEASGAITTETVAAAALPVVVASGAETSSPPATWAPAVIAALPNARGVVYEHLGHFGPFQDVHTIARDILALTGVAP